MCKLATTPAPHRRNNIQLQLSGFRIKRERLNVVFDKWEKEEENKFVAGCRASTMLVCPFSSVIRAPVSEDHRRIVLSSEAEASILPVGSNATLYTWPSRRIATHNHNRYTSKAAG